MTVLVGQSADFGAPSEANTYTNDVVVYYSAGYLAVASGTSDKCYLRPGPVYNWGTCNGAKVMAYNAAGALLGTATFVPADGTGWINKTWDTPFAVTSGLRYYFALVPNTGNVAIINSASTFECQTATGTYASPPATIAPGSDSGNAKCGFNVYADGTVGGGSTAGRSRMLMGFG